MNIHFSLRKQGKRNPVIILQVFDGRFKGRKFMYSTGATISPSEWDKRKSRAKTFGPKAKELSELNKYLDKLEQSVIDYKSERHNSKSLSREDLKAHLLKTQSDENKQPTSEPIEGGFYIQWEKIISTTRNSSGQNISSGTKRSKTQTLELLKKYCIDRRTSLNFESLDMEFYYDFDQFMKEKKLSHNTRGKHIKEIKAVLREALDRDIPINNAFQKKSFKVIRSRPDNVYLNDIEIKKIYSLKLTTAQEKLRDIFVMACYVGARHSDWNQIRKENIVAEGDKEMLKIKQTKTNNFIHVPVHDAVRAILSKHLSTPLKVITNQKFNEALKEICKKAELGDVSLGKETIEKWKLISTHTARRSFATNAYLSKAMDVYQIMQCTGHKSESSFLRYLKLDGKDFAIQAADSKFFKDDSWTSLKVAS